MECARVRDRLISFAVGACALVTLVSVDAFSAHPAVVSAAPAAVPKEIQSLYDKRDYARTLEEIAKLDKDTSGSPDVRRLKIRSLLKLGNPKEALDEYDRLERSLNRDDLAMLREVAFGFIVVMMKDMREQMRGAAYTALKEIDSEDVIRYFEDGLSDGSGPVRALAVEGLGRWEAGRRSPKLRSALEDQAGLVKARAVKALGRSSDPSVIPLLEAASKDELNTVRIAAYGSLLKLGRKEAWEPLRQAAEAANPEDRAEAIRAIADAKDPRGVVIMSDLLNYTQPSVRGAAARGLGHLGHKEAREQIESLLRDPVPAVREAAATALAELGSLKSVPALIQALEDGRYTVRAAVAAALLQLDQPFGQVAPTLRGLAQQNDVAARAAAAHALGKATRGNSQGAISLLESLAADPLPGPRVVALRSLGHIGNRALIPLMKDALHDQNEAVRATAGGALFHVVSAK
ncbi:MAG TPA: HEAT repeat domain-containing protein [Nitrospira sp.]|nr:HEAT repeat domain-containing protein [Nitrospira sp.]